MGTHTDDPDIDDVDTEMIDDDGNTKLLIEAEEGNVEAVKIHLSHSSVCFTDEGENTALHWSARKGHTNLVKLLIPFYTSVDVINVNRMTPMHVCASNGHLDIVKLLLLRSRLSSRDKGGRTPLDLACESGAVDIVNFLLPHSFPNMGDGFGYTCCAFSAKRSKMNVLRCLIPHSLMNCPDCIGQSLTQTCANYYMREELVTLLPYSCDDDGANLLPPHQLSFWEDDISIIRTPCLKHMVLHSSVTAVDACFRETPNYIGMCNVFIDPILRRKKTERSLFLNYISLLLPHASISAYEDKGKKLLKASPRACNIGPILAVSLAYYQTCVAQPIYWSNVTYIGCQSWTDM
ncbi:death-associated protein kinase 1-like [Ornithodoros turicata]|uniref:death-associated protein kinase 1-like n=1 Tax=Ornithodoros turicata TaxID=34597 RepID=UPI003139ECB1